MKINKGPEHTKAFLKPALTVNTGLPFLWPAASRHFPGPTVTLLGLMSCFAAGPGGLVGRNEGVSEGSQRSVSNSSDSLIQKMRTCGCILRFIISFTFVEEVRHTVYKSQ